MSTPPASAADELFALVEAIRLDGRAEAESAPELMLTLKQVARTLKVRKSDVRFAAARLGMQPGAEVAFDPQGRLVDRQLWPVGWLDELRIELERGADINIADVCGLTRGDDETPH